MNTSRQEDGVIMGPRTACNISGYVGTAPTECLKSGGTGFARIRCSLVELGSDMDFLGIFLRAVATVSKPT